MYSGAYTANQKKLLEHLARKRGHVNAVPLKL